MRIAWSGLILHIGVLLWSLDIGKELGKRSEPCSLGGARLLLVSLPGLSRNHVSILETLPGLLTVVHVPDSASAHLSLVAGLDRNPLIPGLADDIFHHTNSSIFSGALPALFPSIWTRMADIDYSKEGGRLGDKEVLDNLKQLLVESALDADLARHLSARSVIIFLRFLGYLRTSNMDILRQTIKGVVDLKAELDKFYKGDNISIIFWGEGDGPLLLWGKRFCKGKTPISSNDLTTLVSAILKREVPAHSKGIVPDDYLSSDEDKANGLYCNAVQLFNLASATQGDNDIIPFWKKFDVEEIESNLTKSKKLLEQGKYQESADVSRKIAVFCLKEYKRFAAVLDTVRVGLMVVTSLSYLALLLTEFAYDEDVPPKPFVLIYLHLFFCGLSCCFFSLPFITPWPNTYHLYLLLPLIFTWAVMSRYYVWLPKFKTINLRTVSKVSWFALVLVMAAEFSLMSSVTTSSFFICVLALLPTLPRFSKAPLILTTGWFLMTAALLGALHLPAYQKPETKAINFAATIALCTSGFAALWVRPLKDRILSIFITILIAVGMLVENMALSYKGDIWFLQYFAWPLIFSPLLPIIGEANRFNRITHVVTSASIVFCLSSARFEGLCFFTVMAVDWLWTLMESYRLKEQLNCESIRRSIFLVFLLLIAGQVVKTLPDAYRPFRAGNWSNFIDIYRELLVSSCVLTVFLTMMESDSHVYTTILLSMVITAIATIRTIIVPGDVYTIQIRGIVFVSAYYLALVMRGKSKPKTEDGIDPIQDELNQ
ncbi:GPI ethanolamine phosphate transferase 1-like isoform X2 [Cimex lectularius]|uniref:GPI ethanolamine phosphate transferase 1 n=1 Tax=Cimex lectularius TaxID=79782 RepID=A0A8I6RD49_CIMLE|nr:GPI ethanolamine phosphate transferase 1-like isoform X2 [Cimex lectularius]